MGITHNLGTIWLDRQKTSNRDYHLTLAQLAELYRVSASVARYRVQELGILKVDPETMPTRVGETLDTVLLEMFYGDRP